MGTAVSKVTAEIVASNLAKPKNSLGGVIIGKVLKKLSLDLETLAVSLCKIQPDYKVLEVGFGPGVGLKAAHNDVKDGSGIIYGADLSDRMVKQASSLLKKEIQAGKIQLHHTSVTQLPFDDSSIDCIFHVNSYYFWPDMDAATKELHRVIKPDGLVVATRKLGRIEYLRSQGYMKYAKTDPQPYMDSMERNGFVDVRDEFVNEEGPDSDVKAIYATANK